MIRYEDLDLVFVSEGAQYDEIELPEINGEMNINRAIHLLESMAITYPQERYQKAINMAIEALKAKTDGDSISRQDAIAAMCGACLDDGSYCGGLCDLTDAINSLPSAEPKTGKCVKEIDEETPNITIWRYECGAKIRGEEE